MNIIITLPLSEEITLGKSIISAPVPEIERPSAANCFTPPGPILCYFATLGVEVYIHVTQILLSVHFANLGFA